MSNFRKLQRITNKWFIVFLFISLITILLNCSCALAPRSFYSYEQEYRPINAEQAEKLKSEIRKYYAAPYQWGGKSAQGTDCSGLISAIYYNALRVVIPHNACGLYDYCVPIKEKQLQFGDLVFFGKNSGCPTHVGLYIKKKYFLDATKAKGVALNNLNSTYYKRQFIVAGRLKIN